VSVLVVPLFLWSPTVTNRSYPTKPVNPDRSPFNKMFPAVNICMVKLQMVIVVVVVVIVVVVVMMMNLSMLMTTPLMMVMSMMMISVVLV